MNQKNMISNMEAQLDDELMYVLLLFGEKEIELENMAPLVIKWS